MKGIFYFLFRHKLWFPFVFHVFFLDSIIIHNFLSWQFWRVRANNDLFQHCRARLLLTCVHGGKRVRGCPRMHMHALTKSRNASAGGDDFSPREFECAWAPIECLPFFLFILLCGFHLFNRCVFMCECFRRHVLVFTATLDQKPFSEIKYIFKV